MFRPMRRASQALTEEECRNILKEGTSGVLAVAGDDGYPYAVPLSYVWTGECLYFHCAASGHKLDGIARNPKVSFCVVGRDEICPERFTTFYKSVIVFGKADVLSDPKEKEDALRKLADRYSPGLEEAREAEIADQLSKVLIIRVMAEQVTGKEAIEFVRRRKGERKS